MTHIRREQEAEGHSFAPEFQMKAFQNLGASVDDLIFIVARMRGVFGHLGEKVADRAGTCLAG